MLSEQSRPIIEATLPLVGERIPFITPVFYRTLFEAHPELLDGIFSRANLNNGEQAQALAGSVAVFAAHLLANPNALPERTLARIAHRHTSLGVTREQYDVVYQYLFAAIAQDLGDAVTPEVAAAWSEVYWLMADTLIAMEEQLYAAQANDKVWTPWRVARKVRSSPNAFSFILEPADDTPVTPGEPGHYISVKVPVSGGITQARQYSLNSPSATHRTFTAALDQAGEVSPVLHSSIEEGDVIEVSNPYGTRTLAESDAPLVFLSAGMGQTPFASMLNGLAGEGSTRRVVVHHTQRELQDWALGQQMVFDVERLQNAELHLWLTGAEDPEALPLIPGVTVHAGRPVFSEIELPEGAELHLCGPLAFMKAMRRRALRSGVAPQRLHYEVFGPDSWLGEREGMTEADHHHYAAHQGTARRAARAQA